MINTTNYTNLAKKGYPESSNPEVIIDFREISRKKSNVIFYDVLIVVILSIAFGPQIICAGIYRRK